MQDEARNPKSHAGRPFRKRLLATAMGAVVAGGGLIAAALTAGAAEGCTGEATAYERALVAGTAEALQAFLKEYPACPLTPAAFALLNTPREQSATTPASLPDIAPAAGDEAGDEDRRERAGQTRPNDPGRGDRDSGGGGTGGSDPGGSDPGT